MAQLWWFWGIVFGLALVYLSIGHLFDAIKNKSQLVTPLAVIAISLLWVLSSALYLILSPHQNLQVKNPFPKPPAPQQYNEDGFPVAERFELDLLPAFYEATNEFFIPILKQNWHIWLPGWALVLLIATLTPEKERRRKQ